MRVTIKKICKKANPHTQYEGIRTGTSYSGFEHDTPLVGEAYFVEGGDEFMHTSTVQSIYTYNKEEGKAFCPKDHFPKDINDFVVFEKGDVLLSTMNSIYLLRYHN